MANQYLPGVIAIPSALQITSISNSNPMVITVSVNPVTASNTYIAGQLVKFFVPISYGMFQVDGLQGQILNVSGNTMTIAIDSSLFDPFVIPSSGEQPASISPAGSRNLQFSNVTDQVGFQSLNNIGN